jgi:predicted NBD/HSP70 family sugar kinase
MVSVGLDVGKTSIGIILENDNGELSSPEYFPSSRYWSQDGLERVIREYLDSKGVDISSVDGIGMAVPGVVDSDRKIFEKDVMDSDIDFLKLEESLGVQVEIANDGDVAVLGQKRKYNSENIVNIIIGSGIGTGVVYDGKLLWGDKSGGPEIGFSYVGESIWQAYGGNVIPEAVNEWLEREERPTDLEENIESAEELFRNSEDRVAEDYIQRLEEYTARGIANSINAYSPDILTFTGSVAVQNPDFIKRCFSQAEEDFFNSKPELEIADTDEHIPLKGAVELARKIR